MYKNKINNFKQPQEHLANQDAEELPKYTGEETKN